MALVPLRSVVTSGVFAQDVSYPVFMKLMEFVYTDEVGDLPFSTAIELLVVAEQYLLDRLKRVCDDKIRRGIALDNVVNICITAHQFQATSLKVRAKSTRLCVLSRYCWVVRAHLHYGVTSMQAICLDFIVEHLPEMRAERSFHALKNEPELLMEIIMRAPTSTASSHTQQIASHSTSARRAGLGPGAGAGAAVLHDARLDSMFF